MVTNLVEDGRHKCAQYWPNSQGTSEHHGPFNITLVDEQIFVDYTVRRLTLNKVSNFSHTSIGCIGCIYVCRFIILLTYTNYTHMNRC